MDSSRSSEGTYIASIASLASLTEEMLGAIGSCAGVEAIIQLWKTGDSVLCRKLCSPRCLLDLWPSPSSIRLVRLEIEGGKSALPWPSRLVANLRGLRNVSSASWKFPSPSDWSALPATLEGIELALPGDRSLEVFSRGVAGKFPNLTSLTLSILQGSIVPTFMLSTQLPFPQLRHLTLLDDTPKIFYSISTLVPAELESLCLHCEPYSSYDMSHIAKFTNLKNLTLIRPCHLTTPANFSFPSSLRKLHIPELRYIKLDKSADDLHTLFRKLPALTDLSISIPIRMFGSTPDASLPAFWDNLKHLKVTERIAKAFPLPTHLVTLDLVLDQMRLPERLPRTIRSLILPKAKLFASTFGNLPPTLTKLVLDTHQLEFPAKEAPVFAFPPTLTHIESPDFKLTRNGIPDSLELRMIKFLPNTVVLYKTSQCFVRVPDKLLLSPNAGQIEGTKFACFFSALSSRNIALLDYLARFQYEDNDDIRLLHLETAAAYGTRESILWALKRKGLLKNYETLEVVSGALKRPDEIIERFQALVEGGFVSILKSDFFVREVIGYPSIALMEWLETLGVTNWDISSNGESPLTRLVLSNADQKIIDWLIERECCRINPAALVLECLQEKSLTYLERLKTLEKSALMVQGSSRATLVLSIMKCPGDLSFLVPILDWLTDPANFLNLDLDHVFLEQMMAAYFDRVWEVYEPDAPLAEHKHGHEIVSITRWFIDHNVDVFRARYPTQRRSMADLVLQLCSVPLLRLLQSVPGDGFAVAILHMESSLATPSLSSKYEDLCTAALAHIRQQVQKRKKFTRPEIIEFFESFNFPPETQSSLCSSPYTCDNLQDALATLGTSHQSRPLFLPM